MTTTKATLSFTINADKSLSLNEAKLGNRTIQAGAATAAMTTLISKLQNHDAKRYNLVLDSKKFTATLELPPHETKFNLRFEDNARKWVINIPLKQETAETFGKDLLDQLRPTPTRVSPALALMTAPVAFSLTPKIAPLPSPPKPFALWRLLDFFASLFSFLWKKDASPEQISTPLIETPIVSPIPETIATTGIRSSISAKRAQSNPMLPGIRPLPNEGNTCFINSIIQALMNAPGLIPLLITAHEAKFAIAETEIRDHVQAIKTKQAKNVEIETAIQELTKGKWFLQYRFTESYRHLNNELQEQIETLKKLLHNQKNWEETRDASAALIHVLRSYNDSTQDITLRPLRGLMENRYSTSQEDASEFLQKIFAPLDPKSTTQLFHTLGEEKRFVPYAGAVDEELARQLEDKKDSSPLPENGLDKKLEPNAILLLELHDERIDIQTLLDKQFATIMDPQEELVCYLNKDKEKAWYRVSEKTQIIEASGASAPEHLIIQFKRYDEEGSKISTAVELPENNKVTVLINNQLVIYDIQTLVLHSGDSPHSGHYFDYVNKNSAWYEANDSRINSIKTLPSETEEQVYVVFLKKSAEKLS